MKPIKVTRTGNRSYTMHVNGVPMVRDGKSMNFDRIAAGLKGGKGWTAPPADAPLFVFTSRKAADSMAHRIGRYCLGLGDCAFAYTDHVDGRAAAPEPIGYTSCACRDCMAVTVGPLGTICSDCTEAGCDAFYTECRRTDAYSAES